jgi:superoxide reductase
MDTQKNFYRCSVCGNLVGLIHSGGGTLVCCGKPMELLTANTTEASKEKHIPVLTRKGNNIHVEVGSVPHPMLAEHYIQWICIAQGNLTQRAELEPGDQPVADFIICDGPVVVYEYCNLHGLWKAELN